MFNITVRCGGDLQTVPFEKEVSLSKALEGAHMLPEMPCAGKGTCGKCRVFVQGKAASPTARELALLKPEELKSGLRLACQTLVQGDCTVTLPEKKAMSAIALKGVMPPVAPKPSSRSWGVAVDIGTTTVAAYLYRLSDCKIMQYACMKNPQSVYGADVISRIEQSIAGKSEELCALVCGCLDSLVADLAQKAGIPPSLIESMVVTGNTTMLYLLTRQDVVCLSHAPFEADRLFAEQPTARELGMTAVPDAEVYLPRCISAFVGADITMAILASGMMEKDRAMLIDIGTNGEIALHAGGRLVCCSTAAGPALEGANLHMGMSALPGAIDTVKLTEQGIVYTTIGGAPAAGLCGSGIIDAAAALLQAGIIDETGLILEEGHNYPDCICKADGLPAFRFAGSEVILTQQDIRNIQLAKGAICAGLLTLLEEAALSPQDVECLYIAGGFGSYINIQNAAEIGLIPRQLAQKAVVIGNAAGAGACMLLQNTDLRARSRKLAESAATLELSRSAKFSENYMNCILFAESAESEQL